MKTPAGLQALLDDGVIDAVLRPLKSGKEASVYVVRSGDEVRCAKVYKDMAQRSFQARAQYQEGRKVRGSREARAMGKASKYGKKAAGRSLEEHRGRRAVPARAAGVRVPRPHGYFNGVLVMELVTDSEGHSAPRLGEVELDAEQAREYFASWCARSCACCAGHDPRRPVRVQRAGGCARPGDHRFAAGGQRRRQQPARAMLLRDVNKLRSALAFFAPELDMLHYGEEMWALFEAGELQPDTALTGRFDFSTHDADVGAVLMSIEDARQEAVIRQQGREAAESAD
jgi:RIO kinase 1